MQANLDRPARKVAQAAPPASYASSNPVPPGVDHRRARPSRFGRFSDLQVSVAVSLGLVGVFFAIAAPTLLEMVPRLLGQGEDRDIAILLTSGTLILVTVTTILTLLVFTLLPKLNADVAKPGDIHRVESEVGSLGAVVKSLDSHVRNVLAQPHLVARARSGQRPITETRELDSTLYVSRTTGVVTTLEPGWRPEMGGGRQTSGDVLVYPSHQIGVVSSFARLQAGNPVERWRLVLPLDGSFESLLAFMKFRHGLNVYGERAQLEGAAFDLSKLEIRVTEEPRQGKTIVIMNQWEHDTGQSYREVLTYDERDIAEGRNIMGITTRGPDYEAARQRELLMLSRSVPVDLAAVDLLLGACMPDRAGFVSSAAIKRWETDPKLTLADLLRRSGYETWPEVTE